MNNWTISCAEKSESDHVSESRERARESERERVRREQVPIHRFRVVLLAAVQIQRKRQS